MIYFPVKGGDKMDLKKIFVGIADVLFPPTCEVCGQSTERGERVCSECIGKFRREMFVRCPKCNMTADKCLCFQPEGKSAFSEIGGRSSLSLTFYMNVCDRSEDRITEKMIFALKERRLLFDFFANECAGAIKRHFDMSGESVGEWILTYPPRSEKKYAELEYDQCEEIVKRMAEILGIKWTKTFKRDGGLEQKGLTAEERAENAANALVLIRKNVVNGGKYIVFDDVFTTGATLNTAARNLRFGGASEVFPVTIAKTAHK